MDDIPFFDSAPYSIRGGIFPDSKRKERASSFDDLDKGDLTPETQAHKATQSLSGLDLAGKPSKAGELVITGPGRADNISASMPNITVEDDVEPALSSPPSRRSTWFMSPSKKDKDETRARRESVSDIGSVDLPLETVSETALAEGVAQPEPEIEVPIKRAKTTSAVMNGHALTPSMPVTLANDTPAPTPTPDIAVTDTTPSSAILATTESVAVSDAQRIRSPSASSHKSTISADLSSWLSRSSNSKIESDGSDDERPASARTSAASTLISTWKSKAAEKQLASTAREAMKKWGWGAGRKSGGQTTEGLEGDGETTPRSRSPTPKPTYAEMRAHVEERRQHGRASSGSRTSIPVSVLAARSSESLHPPQSESPPQSVLEPPAEISSAADLNRKRTLSSSSSHKRRGSNASSNAYTGGLSPQQSPHLNAASDSMSAALSPRHIAPSVPKTTTEISHLSLTSTPSLPTTTASSTLGPASSEPLNRQSSTSSNPSLPAIDPSLRARTISSRSTGGQSPVLASQPSSAAMMTIPGIHASHRNEIMALGSAPPPAAPGVPPRPGGDGAAAIVPRLPASLQNVYRIFNKNGVATGGKPGTVSEPSLATSEGAELPLSDSPATEGTSSSSIPTPVEGELPPVKRQPPPLPPRRSTKNLLAEGEGATLSASTPATVPDATPATDISRPIYTEAEGATKSIDGDAPSGSSIAVPDALQLEDGAPRREDHHVDQDSIQHQSLDDNDRSTAISLLEPVDPAIGEASSSEGEQAQSPPALQPQVQDSEYSDDRPAPLDRKPSSAPPPLPPR